MAGQYRFKTSRLAQWALWLSRLAIPVAILSFLLMRFGNMHPSIAVYCFATALVLSILSILVSIAAFPAIWFEGVVGGKRLWGTFLRSLFILVPAGIFTYFYVDQPAFSDVSTNPIDPPVYEAAWQEREDEDNSLAIYGIGVREQQALAFPDLVTKKVDHPLELVHLMVEDEVKETGWDLLRASSVGPLSQESTFELATRSAITGLRYVIIIRLRDNQQDGTEIDMRSASLWGNHDLGLNARRITGFMTDLNKRLGESIKRYELRLEQIERQRKLDRGPLPRSKPKHLTG